MPVLVHRFVLCCLVLTAAMGPIGSPVAASGPEDGIKVHGRWTIDVRNADGTLAAHYQFENALTTDGARALATALSSPIVPAWEIRLESTAGAGSQVCVKHQPDPVPAPCSIVAAGDPVVADQFQTLQLRLLPPALDRIELAGNATVTYGGSIDRVRTYFAHAGVPFTERSLGASTIAVTAGQKVYVKVVISFS